jgi:hypothetical protein
MAGEEFDDFEKAALEGEALLQYQIGEVETVWYLISIQPFYFK